MPPQLAAQTTYTVDLNGLGYTSITSAANLAVAGDTIEVVGAVDPTSGLPVAYTNGNGETFPILLQSGVNLRPSGPNPVYIWPTGGANPTSIIEVVGTTSPPLTGILQMHVFGGQVGIDVSGSGASDSTNVVLQKVTLGRSIIDLTAIATNDARVDLVMNDCKVSNIAIPLAENPGTLRSTSIGLQFHAVEGTGVPKVNAEINDLTARGTFAYLSGVPLIAGVDADIERTFGQEFTRLIEVFSAGTTVNPGKTGIPETDVNLTINGGILEGGPGLSAPGWDIGIYSMALPQDSSDAFNYRANAIIEVNGTSISDFVEAGIYATVGKDVRSRIVVRGQTRISGTGSLQTHVPGEYFHSGIHLYARTGYLGLSVADSLIEDNTGNGITLRCAATDQRAFSLVYSMGMPINLVRSQIHGNGGDGVELEAGVGSPLQPNVERAIVGGTRTAWVGNTRLVVGSMSDPITPYGQGVIDQCAISNNGERGIRAHVNNGTDYYVFCRITNNIIWNNPLGGFVGDTTTGNGGTGYLLTPILHCTFVGNGGALANPYNIEIFEPAGLTGKYYYEPAAGFAGELLGMEVFNCIFDMQNPNNFDFGPNLESLVVSSDPLGYYGAPIGQGQGQDDFHIAVGGTRFAPSPGITLPPFSNSNAVTYQGPLIPTDRKAKQFFLTPLPANLGIIDSAPTWQTVVAPETDSDYSGDLRNPVINGDRDKGADEQ